MQLQLNKKTYLTINTKKLLVSFPWLKGDKKLLKKLRYLVHLYKKIYKQYDLLLTTEFDPNQIANLTEKDLHEIEKKRHKDFKILKKIENEFTNLTQKPMTYQEQTTPSWVNHCVKIDFAELQKYFQEQEKAENNYTTKNSEITYSFTSDDEKNKSDKENKESDKKDLLEQCKKFYTNNKFTQ